ncbi:MAG TPA: hypothetical protein VFX12_15315 [Vicinamibacterales bacterium]|nr:hypothetical protein [Vicinamibacterales bacterium]
MLSEAHARTTATILLGAAAAGAAYAVLRDRRLRRAAWQLARRWATGPAAAWMATELRRAWDESGSRRTDIMSS